MSSATSRTKTGSQFNFGFYQEHILHSLIKYFHSQRAVCTTALLQNTWKLFYLTVQNLVFRNWREKNTQAKTVGYLPYRVGEGNGTVTNNLSLWQSLSAAAASTFFKVPLNYVMLMFLLRVSCEKTVLKICRPARGFRHSDARKGSPDTWPKTLPGPPGEDAEAATSLCKGKKPQLRATAVS